MPDSVSTRKFPLIPVGVVILGAAIALFFLLRRDRGGMLPMPTSGCYEAMVSQFYSGTVALIVQDPDRPEPELKKASECVPEEPSPWANLGLHYLRGRSRMADAERTLKRAQELAPNSTEIAALMGHLENQRGRVDAAVEAFRKAVELESGNIHARWWLAKMLDRQRAQGYESEVQKQLDGILSVEPDNLAALAEFGAVAARRGDGDGLKRAIEGIEKQSKVWPQQTKAALEAVKVSQSDPRSAVIRFLPLTNLVKTESAYKNSLLELTPSDNAVGMPLERFLRLPNPSPQPAPADTAMTFTEEPLFKKEPSATPLSPAKRLLIARLKPEVTAALAESFRLPTSRESGLSAIIADGASVQIVTGRNVTRLPFPGGPTSEPPSTCGIVTADLNYDFLPDLVLAGAGGVRIFRQGPNGILSDVSAATKLPSDVLLAAAFGVWVADTDLDGDLDLVVGYSAEPTRVFRNNGDGTFKLEGTFASVTGLRSFAWADLDGDGDPDPAFADSRNRLTILSNERSGRFLQRELPESTQSASNLAASDMNRDMVVDLIILQPDGTITRLSDREDGKTWEAAALAQGNAVSSDIRLFLADLDNNGGTDILVAGPDSGQAWLADEKGGFAALPSPLGAGIQDVADTNSNGLLDIVAMNSAGAPVVRLNESKAGYEWLELRPRATFVQRSDPRSGGGDSRINSFGIGGEVEARSSLLVQKVVVAGPTIHLGLGKNVKADYARFIWPNGSVQGEFNLNSNQSIVTVQRLKGSCPWLFAWNGEKMEFITDVLWKSPLGLRINAQDTAGVMTTEDWVKVRGDQLKAKDGYYDLRITAELWETHFFDHVALLAVDHPAESDVFVDERFAFPPPPLKVHSLSAPRPIMHAMDDRGADVTNVVKYRDRKYLDTFGRGAFQGITRDHYVEVEIPAEAAARRRIALLGFGWLQPTDSSINVAISQGNHAQPAGLSIEVPAGKKWVTAKSGLGFPAGKLKTVLLDLAEVLKEHPSTTRFRLCTNLEIFWDSLEWAEWEPDPKVKMHRLPPEEADLRYRGFSVTSEADESSPELPDYDRIWTRTQMWRDLIGFYTRFGDVNELLEKVDDRYVILNAGDEMAFRFRELAPPPPGWKRDFFFISDGWEKDGDYNTGFSKTVLPLPSHSDPKYATPPACLEDDPVFKRHPKDWETYHTRWVSPSEFRSLMLPRGVER